MKRYSFPEYGVTIEAQSLADATAQLEAMKVEVKDVGVQSKRRKKTSNS